MLWAVCSDGKPFCLLPTVSCEILVKKIDKKKSGGGPNQPLNQRHRHLKAHAAFKQ